MKQIYFFHPSSELYGADKILTYIIKCYTTYKVTLILRTEGPLIEYIKTALPNVEIKIIPNLPIIAKKNLKPKGILFFIYSLFKFRILIKSIIPIDTQIVYLNTLAVVPILFCIPSQKTTKITHVHEILKNNNILHKIINKIALKYSDYIFCVSNAVKNNLLSVASEKEKLKLRTIQNGITFDKDSNTKSSVKIKFDSSLVNFALIGRIKPNNKGQNFLSQAIAFLPQELKNKSHFYYIGGTVSGQEYMLTEVTNLIKDLKINKYVDIIPFVDNIKEIYQKIDVILVPSLCDDSFPTTVLEGMYWKRPIIGTNVGGIPEMIINNTTGFLINKNSVQELTEKISYFINNPEKIKEMGENGEKLFKQKFTVQSFEERYNQTLKDLSII